jgi:hypothetical protein
MLGWASHDEWNWTGQGQGQPLCKYLPVLTVDTLSVIAQHMCDLQTGGRSDKGSAVRSSSIGWSTAVVFVRSSLLITRRRHKTEISRRTGEESSPVQPNQGKRLIRPTQVWLRRAYRSVGILGVLNLDEMNMCYLFIQMALETLHGKRILSVLGFIMF